MIYNQCIVEWDGGRLQFTQAGCCPELDAILVRSDGVLRLMITPHVPLRFRRIALEFKQMYPAGSRVFMNGYQSWTDSHELPCDARMNGLRFAPPALVQKRALDGYGDARFTAYDYRPGHLHGFSYGYLRCGNQYSFLGSTGERNGFTTLRTDIDAGTFTAEKECPPNQISEPFEAMGVFVANGSEAQVFDGWFEAMGVRALPAPKITGYTSWYRHYQNITEDNLWQDLQGIEGLDLFQIDDGFETHVGDWLSLKPDAFPDGLQPLVQEIRRRDMTAGLWLAPFVCEEDSELCHQHPDWLQRDETGAPLRGGENWSGIYALDTQLPAVREYIRTVFDTVKGWGFTFLKLDFLYAACMVPYGGKTRGQLMCEAMDFLRSCAKGMVLLGCGVPLQPAFGKVEYCRIGCDAGLDWDGKPWERLLHRERVSTKNSLGNTIGRRQLDGRAFGNDPDVLLLRQDVRLTPRQRALVLKADLQCGSMMMTSDDVAAYTPQQRAMYEKAFAQR